jgi:hypothetical protein
MNTTNKCSALEIFDGLNKLMKLSYENQFKILISFFYSMNGKLLEDTKNIFIAKCQELHKEGKIDQLSKNTVETITLLINSVDVLKSDSFFTNTFINFLINTQNKAEDYDYEYKLKEATDSKQIAELENFMENIQDETIEFEKILHDLGPFIINNSIPLKSDIIDFKIDEKRLANFILFLCKHQTWVEDKENRHLNKVFLKSLNNDLSMTIDENNEKKIIANWNLDNFYKFVRKQIDSMDVKLKIYYIIFY